MCVDSVHFAGMSADGAGCDGAGEEWQVHRSVYRAYLIAVGTSVFVIARVGGDVAAELGMVTVGETVETVIERISPIAEAKGVHLVAAGDARGALAVADRRRLTQVLVNLVSNAIKFTPAQGQVTISCSLVAEGIQVAVTDTGIGIAPEEQSRIFSEFVQVDNEDTRSQAGTGLGLVLTMGLMTLMGGSIRVASLRGQGRTFTITLQSAPREGAVLRVLWA